MFKKVSPIALSVQNQLSSKALNMCKMLILVVLIAGTSSGLNTGRKGDECEVNSDCNAWLNCENNICKWCSRETFVCNSRYENVNCCDGTRCEIVPGSMGTSMCLYNHNMCVSTGQCPQPLKCLMRLGKCGMCKNIGEACTLPHREDSECCSSHCKISSNGTGVCTDATYIDEAVTEPAKIGKVCYNSSECEKSDCVYNRCATCQRMHTTCDFHSECCSGTCGSKPNYLVGYSSDRRNVCV